MFQQNPKFVQQITGFREKNGVREYQVVWKQNSWVEATELEKCTDTINAYNGLEVVSKDVVCMEKLSLQDKENEIVPVKKEMEMSIPDIAQCEDLCLVKKAPTENVAAHMKVISTIKTPLWYKEQSKKEKVQTELAEFNRKYCMPPCKNEMKKAKAKHDIMMKQITSFLQENDEFGCKSLEFTGSSYEGLKITGDGLEFDVMFLLRGGDKLKRKTIPGQEGYHYLEPEDPEDPLFSKCLTSENYLCPEKLKSKFKGAMQKFIDTNKQYEGLVKIIDHGPAIQIDVKKAKDDAKEWYSVDLVPAYEIPVDGKKLLYVAKPLKEEGIKGDSWRRSFSQEEKQILKGIDSNNQCRREVVRTIKALFKGQSTLKAIPSYFLKTILFHINDHMDKEKVIWNTKDYPDRVMDMLAIVEGYLDIGWLPNYFVPSVNLLASYKENEKKLKNIKNCVAQLRGKEKKFSNAIELSSAEFEKLLGSKSQK